MLSRLLGKRFAIAGGLLCTSVVLLLGAADAFGNDADKSKATFRVVGYLPEYRLDHIDPVVGQSLTDLVFFSVNPEPSGKFSSKSLTTPQTTALLKRFRDEQHVRVHLCVGGWGRSKGFAEIAATPESRQRFAEGLSEFCRTHQFAGADIDWEHPKDATESQNYGLLLKAIAQVFQPQALQLTAAMAGWQTLTPEGIAAVDAIHLMSYDADGKHSTMELAQSDVKKLLAAGVPPEKIRLGLPFYGRGITRRDQVKTYAEIVQSAPNATITDEVDGLYFNGPATIQAKIRYAKEQKLGGVMIWEIGQDAQGPASLLKVIHAAAK